MKNTRWRLGDEEKMSSEFGGGDVGFLLRFQGGEVACFFF